MGPGERWDQQMSQAFFIFLELALSGVYPWLDQSMDADVPMLCTRAC